MAFVALLVAGAELHSQGVPSVAARHQVEGVCGGVRARVVDAEYRPPSGLTPLTLQAFFDADVTAAERAVIQQAMSEWDTILISSGTTASPYFIGFHHEALTGNKLARAYTESHASGLLLRSNIYIDNDGSTTWFVDPSPGNDIEFEEGAPAGHDLLSVMRHEIGHAIGWVGAENPRVDAYESNSVFDRARLNILVTTGGAHADPSAHPNDLMVPSMGPGVRRRIQLYPDATMPARAFSYELPLRVIDRNVSGSPQTGSVHTPFSTLNLALIDAPPNSVFLFIPGDYPQPSGLFPLETPLTFLAARGNGATLR